MAPLFLRDTNRFGYIGRRRPPQVMARFARLTMGETALSVVTYGELVFGVEKQAARTREFDVLDEIVHLLPILPLHPQAGRIYGKIRAFLDTRCEAIGANEYCIAAHAQALDVTLV